MLAIALSVELLSLGMATSTTLGGSGVPRKITILSILGLSVLVLGSALASAALLSGISDVYLEVILSFGLAALLFLVTEELLVEAHEGVQPPCSPSPSLPVFSCLCCYREADRICRKIFIVGFTGRFIYFRHD